MTVIELTQESGDLKGFEDLIGCWLYCGTATESIQTKLSQNVYSGPS